MLSENRIEIPNLTLEDVNCLPKLQEPKQIQQVLNSNEKDLPSTPLLGSKIFTVPEVAAYLKISKSKIYHLVSRKRIPHLRLGRNVRIRESDLLKWLERQVEKAPPS